MSVNAADAGNSSNSNFHKIQIDSNTQNTIDNNTNYYKSNDNLNKNDNINLKNQYTKQEKNENNTYTKNNNLYVEDLNSTNGIYVNGEKIEEKLKLIADDEIKIGSAIFKVLKSGK